MTPQFKAAQARAQRKEAAMTAHENPAQASTAALLAGLARQIRNLSDPDQANADCARWQAGLLVAELCARHGITPKPGPPSARPW